MIKAIVFDMDDTLVQTKKIKYAAHKHTAKTFYNLELTDEALDKHWGKPFDEVILGAYGAVDSLDQILKNYYGVTRDFPLVPHAHAVEVVTQLAQKLPIGLLTAANLRLMSDGLADVGINQASFAYIQTSEDTTVHKPDPQVFAPTLEFFAKKGIKPTEIMYVGDVLNDYHAASGAGVQFVGIAGHSIPRSAFIKARAQVVDSLLDLLSLLN